MLRTASLLAATLVLLASPGMAAAQVSLKEMQLRKVVMGTEASPDAQYVVLEVANLDYFDEDELVRTRPDGQVRSFVTFPDFTYSPVRDGLLYAGTAEAAEHFDVTIHVEATTHRLEVGSGRLCLYVDGVQADCIAYGDYPGHTGSYGDPVGPVGLGQALERVDTTGVNTVDWIIVGAGAENGNGENGNGENGNGENGNGENGNGENGNGENGNGENGNGENGNGENGNGEVRPDRPVGPEGGDVERGGCSSVAGATAPLASILLLGLGLSLARRFGRRRRA